MGFAWNDRPVSMRDVLEETYPPEDARSGERLPTKFPHGLVGYRHEGFVALWDEKGNRHVCLPLPRKRGDLQAALINLGFRR